MFSATRAARSNLVMINLLTMNVAAGGIFAGGFLITSRPLKDDMYTRDAKWRIGLLYLRSIADISGVYVQYGLSRLTGRRDARLTIHARPCKIFQVGRSDMSGAVNRSDRPCEQFFRNRLYRRVTCRRAVSELSRK